MTNAIVVLSTCSSEEEASRIARELVEDQLAACVNIVSPVRSLYRWKGKVCDEKECLLFIKTGRETFEALEKKVKALHSYDVPELICLPVLGGSFDYLAWMEETLRKF